MRGALPARLYTSGPGRAAASHTLASKHPVILLFATVTTDFPSAPNPTARMASLLPRISPTCFFVSTSQRSTDNPFVTASVRQSGENRVGGVLPVVVVAGIVATSFPV